MYCKLIILPLVQTTVNGTCPDTVDTKTQMMNTPGYPDVYPNQIDCYWTIKAPLGLRLKLHSFSYAIEYSSTCNFDYLKIYEEESENTTAAKICGYDGNHDGAVSEGTTLRLHFHSDNWANAKGFKTKFAILGK